MELMDGHWLPTGEGVVAAGVWKAKEIYAVAEPGNVGAIQAEIMSAGPVEAVYVRHVRRHNVVRS